MGGQQSIRIPFSSDAKKGVKELAQEISDAEKDVRKYEKAIKDAKKTGTQLSASTVDAYHSAMGRVMSLRERQAQERIAKTEARTAKTDARLQRSESVMVRKYERIGHRLTRIFGDETFRKLASGQAITAGDVLRTALSSERVGLAIGKAFKMDVAAVARLQPLLGLAVEAGSHGYYLWQQKRQMERDSDYLQMKIRKGLIGQQAGQRIAGAGAHDDAEMAFSPEDQFGMRGGRLGKLRAGVTLAWDSFMGRDRAMEMKGMIEERAELFNEMSAREIDRAVERRIFNTPGATAFNGFFRSKNGKAPARNIITDKKGNQISGIQIKARIEEEIRKEKDRSHFNVLPAALEARARNEAAAGLNIDPAAIEEFKKDAGNRQTARERPPDINREMREKHQKQMYDISLATYQRRVPANPTD